jgi:hypothetical protein
MNKTKKDIEQRDQDLEEHVAFDAWIDAHDRAEDEMC